MVGNKSGAIAIFSEYNTTTALHTVGVIVKEKL
jgi:hypothetical protein